MELLYFLLIILAASITQSSTGIGFGLVLMALLPFFIIQSPIWLSGWFSSKIGFKPFITLLLIFMLGVGIYFFKPQIASDALNKVISVKDFIKTEYFASDSLNITNEQLSTIPTVSTTK